MNLADKRIQGTDPQQIHTLCETQQRAGRVESQNAYYSGPPV